MVEILYLGVCGGPWGVVTNFYEGKGRKMFLYMENNLRGNNDGCCVMVIFI